MKKTPAPNRSPAKQPLSMKEAALPTREEHFGLPSEVSRRRMLQLMVGRFVGPDRRGRRAASESRDARSSVASTGRSTSGPDRHSTTLRHGRKAPRPTA